MDVNFNRVSGYGQMKQPGDGYWTGSAEPDKVPGRLMFKCPCGCGITAGIKVAGDGKWEWNGDMDKPTCTPSILINAGHWHGYLTDGVFKTC